MFETENVDASNAGTSNKYLVTDALGALPVGVGVGATAV